MRIIDQQPAKFKIHRTTAWRVLTRGFTMNKENRSALDRELFPRNKLKMLAFKREAVAPRVLFSCS